MSDAQKDSSNDAIYVMAFFLAIYIIITIFFDEQIATVHLWIRGLWADLAAAILPFDKFDKIKLAIDTYAPREWLQNGNALKQLSRDLVWVMWPPLAGIFGYYAYRVWRRNPGMGLRRVHDRKSLIKSEVRLWPWIAPVVDLELTEESIETGKWAMALPPVDFCRKYRLLEGREVNKLRAEKLFASQLGKLWEGPEKLTGHVRALYACFLAQACQDKDGARDGLRVLALSMTKGEGDYSFVDALIKKHQSNEAVQEIFERHAYVVTVMSGMLEKARRSGVMPPAFFIWLRPRNRALWYALNNVGRRTAFCECAGVQAHFLAEKVAGHRIERPYIGQAVKALERALREYKFE